MSKQSYAHTILVGRMGKDIEVFTTSGDKDIGTISVGVNSGWGDREVTSWFTCKIFNAKDIERLEQWAGKGARVLISGELVTRKATVDGRDRYYTEIQVGFGGHVELLDTKDESEQRRAGGDGRGERRRPADDDRGQRQQRNNGRDDRRDAPSRNPFDDLDDDIPF